MSHEIVPPGFTAGAMWILAATAAGAVLTASCRPGEDQVGAERAQRPSLSVSSSNDWSFYRYDLLGQSFVDQPLTTSQARGFTAAWTFHGAGSDANPIVVGSTLYITESNGYLFAVDVSTGQARWSQPIGIAPPTSCSRFTGGPVGAAAVVGGTVFVPGGDGSVYAFDKDTGQRLWSTSIANVAGDEFLWASAFPLHGRIYVGVATLYEPICGPTPGRVVALDQVTGAVVGTWWVNPQHAPGGTVWTRPAYDAATNRLFFTTGQGQAGVDLASQPLAQAFVAIDADTLQVLDSFQPVTAPFVADYDFGASPTLFDTADGRHLIAAANKNGWVYALDRDHLNQGVVWAYQVSVPGDSPDLGTSTIVSAASAHGSLFVGGGQTPDGFAGAVAALDPATGAVHWMFHPDGFVLAGLTAIGDVLVAEATHLPDRTGRLYVLDQATGAPLFQLHTPGPLYAQPSFASGRLFVSDASGIVYALQPPAPSGTSAIDFGTGFSAAGLQLNGSAALSGTRLRLTNGGFAEAASAFFTTPVSVQSFTTDFSFQLTSASADGLTFTLQGIGPAALGPSGGGLGYGPDSPSGAPGIGRSVAVKFDLYDNAGEGINSTGLYTNGVSPTAPAVTLSGGVNLHSGDVFNVHITYDGANLAMTIADASTAARTTVTFPVDIPAAVGSTTAYAGFTAGTGGLAATQDILSWTFSPGGTSPQAAATPTFSPAPGTYSSAQSVTLSDATAGATIYYTTDGTTPTTASTLYTGPITVSTTTTLKAIATASGLASSAVASGTYTIQPAGTSAIDFGAGFSAAGLQLNGSAALSGTRLRLTNGGFAEAASAFFTTPVSVQSFTTDFSFQLTSASADGLTFTLQGIGPAALGPSGGGLGYGPDSPSGAPGIGRSVAVKFDLYDNAGEGINSTGLYTNGVSPTAPAVTLSGGVNLHSGDVFNVHITYDRANLAMTIADASTAARTTVTFPVDIPAAVGSTTAYAGFTAGTGGLAAIQDVLSWTYASGPQPAGDFTVAASPSSVTTSGAGSTASTIRVTAQNGFSGTVNLSASGIPAGATATLDPTSITGSGSSTLTLSAGSAAAGTYTVTVTGTAGSLAHTTNVSWTISTGAVPSPIFSDSFDRTTGLGSNWSVQHGSFTTDGTYAVSGAPPVNGNWASVVPAIGTDDYDVVAEIIVPSGSLYSGIVARSSVSGAFDEDLYAAQISTNGTVNLYRRNNWSWTQLGSVAAGIVAGTQYTLELVATGSSPVHLEVWLDGARYISYDDSSSSRLTGGIPGMENYNANVRYNSFGVYAR